MAAANIGRCVIKAQVPAGKRGKAGGIKLARTPEDAERAAENPRLPIGDFTVERVLVEPQVAIAREFYAAVLNDTAARKPLILFSIEGGMDIEDLAATRPKPSAAYRSTSRNPSWLDAATSQAALGVAEGRVARVLGRLYAAYRTTTPSSSRSIRWRF